MKNVSLILNLVLLIAVGLLFYLHFKGNKSKGIVPEEMKISTTSTSGIYFVNTDSLWKNYEFVKKSEEKYILEKTGLESKFQARVKGFEKEAIQLQEKFQKGLMSQEEAQNAQMKMSQEEQKIMEYKDELSLKLIEQEKEMNDKIQAEIYKYLKQTAADKDITYILGYTQGGGSLLYGKDSLEITKEVIDGLNKTYQEIGNAEKKKK